MSQLKYLFKATFKDGTCFLQNEEDRSFEFPTKSSFTDLLNLLKDENRKLEKFELIPVEQGGDHFLVDLETGHFEINSVPFVLHYDERHNLSNYRLIYWRPRREHVQQNTATGQLTPMPGEIFYKIGWQANLPDGSNVERTIVVE